MTDEEGLRYLKLMLRIKRDFEATLKKRLPDGKAAEIKIRRTSLLDRIR